MVKAIPNKEDFHLYYVKGGMGVEIFGEVLAVHGLNDVVKNIYQDSIPVDNLIDGSKSDYDMFEMCYPGLDLKRAIKAWENFKITSYQDAHYWITLDGSIR